MNSILLTERIAHIAIERNADMLLNTCKDIGLAVNTGKTKYMEIGRHRGMVAKIAKIAKIARVVPEK